MNDMSMPAVPAPTQAALPVQAAASSAFDWMPQSFPEALRLADMLAGANMVPEAYRGNPGNVFLAMQAGAELTPRLKPLQALQSIAVIGNRPGLFGDAGKAILMANGCTIIEQDTETIRRNQVAACTIKRQGRPDVTRTFSVEDAQTANLWGKAGPWKNYPYRQMAWRAFWFAARDAAPDILKGMAGREELIDMLDVTAQGSASVGEGNGNAREGVVETKSERLKAEAKGGPEHGPIAVEEVVRKFNAAKDADEVKAIRDWSRGRVEGENDRKVALDAYNRAVARVRASAVQHTEEVVSGAQATTATSTNTAGAPAPEALLKRIDAAKDVDEANQALADASQYPDGEWKVKLLEAARAKVAGFAQS